MVSRHASVNHWARTFTLCAFLLFGLKVSGEEKALPGQHVAPGNIAEGDVEFTAEVGKGTCAWSSAGRCDPGSIDNVTLLNANLSQKHSCINPKSIIGQTLVFSVPTAFFVAVLAVILMVRYRPNAKDQIAKKSQLADVEQERLKASKDMVEERNKEHNEFEEHKEKPHTKTHRSEKSNETSSLTEKSNETSALTEGNLSKYLQLLAGLGTLTEDSLAEHNQSTGGPVGIHGTQKCSSDFMFRPRGTGARKKNLTEVNFKCGNGTPKVNVRHLPSTCYLQSRASMKANDKSIDENRTVEHRARECSFSPRRRFNGSGRSVDEKDVGRSTFWILSEGMPV